MDIPTVLPLINAVLLGFTAVAMVLVGRRDDRPKLVVAAIFPAVAAAGFLIGFIGRL